MGSFILTLKEMLKHPGDLYPLLKLKMAAKKAEEHIPAEPHWWFCYSTLHKVSKSFSLFIQQLNPDLRDPDDTSIDPDIKVPILITFHQHIYDPDWHFACGRNECKVLMDGFYHVVSAFLELKKDYQEVIEDITMQMGAGMAKFVCKEVETVDDYDEYCHYVAGLVGLGLSNIFHASGTEVLFPESLSNSMGVFLQKVNIIQDYLEDINETPKSPAYWPREIWSKYANKLEDLKYEQNSEKAIRCLNDMVTNAIIHIEDCFKYMSDLRDPAIFRFCAIPQVIAYGTLALCYNNINVYKGVVKMRHGLAAKVIDRTRTIGDVYRAFYDFSSMLKSKVDMHDPNAVTTITRIEAVQKICKDSGTLSNRKPYKVKSETSYSPALVKLVLSYIYPSNIKDGLFMQIALAFIIMATLYAYLSV